MRIDDRELAVGLAAQQVGGAGGLVVEQLSEEHGDLRESELIGLDKLSSDLLNSNGGMTAAEKNALFEAIAVMGKAFASPVPARAARPARPGAAHGRGARPRERPVDGQRVPAPAGAARRGDGHARARGHERALRARRRRGAAARGWRCATRRSPRLAEVERAARDYLGEDVEAIGRDELIARLRRGDVVLVDVRPAEEFEAGHIDGARSIPLEELERRLAELPADREVVAYCRGPFCAYAHEAVRRLRAAGRAARRLEDGWPEWRLSRASSDLEGVT